MEDCQVMEGFEELVYQPQPSEYFNPLNLGRIVVLDARQRWYGVVVETIIEEGVVRRLAEIAEDAGIIIRFIQFSNIEPHDSLAKAIAFLDFSDTSVTPEEALRLVRKQPFVRSAHLIAPNSQGVLFDNHFFPLVVGKRRAVIFRRRVYESLFKGIREKFGTAGEAMLYYQGYAVGQRTCQAYREDTGIEEPETLVGLGKAYFKTSGWGIMDVVNLSVEKGEAQVRIYGSFECESGKDSEAPYGHFIRGILAGFFSNIFQREAKAVETKCIATGDPYCEYTVKT
jgi:predicted hydrocarbon binding protein